MGKLDWFLTGLIIGSLVVGIGMYAGLAGSLMTK